MKRDERQIVHELAELYGIQSESQDPEPQRNVVLFKGYDMRVPQNKLIK